MSSDAGDVARILWRVATVIGRRVRETRDARTLVLDVPDWPGHRAGQHVDVRLTAEDGYQTERSYSIASPPEEPQSGAHRRAARRWRSIAVSRPTSFRVGDKLELRGPIGGYFVWDIRDGGPLVLVGGGSGIVPLMAMLRHRARGARGAGARDRIHQPDCCTHRGVGTR